MPEDVSKKVEDYTEIIRRRLAEGNSKWAEGANRLGDKDADHHAVEWRILRRFLYTMDGKNTSIITFESDTLMNHTVLYRVIPPYSRSVQQIIFLRYMNGFYHPVVFKVNNKWQHLLPVEVRLEAPFDELFMRFQDPKIFGAAQDGTIAPTPPLTTRVSMSLPTSMTPPAPRAPMTPPSPRASPVQDDLLERFVPSAYRIQAVTDKKDCFHTMSIIRHNYVGDVDKMPEKLSKAVGKYAEQSRTYMVKKNDDLAEGVKRLAYKDDNHRLVESRILRKFLQRADNRNASIIIYEPAANANDKFHYTIIIPNSNSSQDTIFLRYFNDCYQPLVFKVNNKWQHRIPVEVKFEAPFDIMFKLFSSPAIFEGEKRDDTTPMSPPVTRETPSLPTRSDPFFEALVPRSAYRIQSVPGDGNCFYYAISLYLLQIDDLNGISRPVPQNIVDTMVKLRKGVARDIYENPRYLQEMYIRDLHHELPPKNTDTGNPDKEAFVNYFLTKNPYADDVEVRVMQEAIARTNVAVVIYDPSSIQQFYSYNGVVPETLESLIVLKLDHEHYEPFIFHVDGKWQHTIPIGMKDSATYGKLFDSIADMWTELGIKIFPDSMRRILQRIAQLEEVVDVAAIEKSKKEMASEDGSSTPPVSPWWRRPTSSMEDEDSTRPMKRKNNE